MFRTEQHKRQLGRILVEQFHSTAEDQASETAWLRQFSQRDTPQEMPFLVITAPMTILSVLVAAELAESKTAARRLIQSAATCINGEKLEDIRSIIYPEEHVSMSGDVNSCVYAAQAECGWYNFGISD